MFAVSCSPDAPRPVVLLSLDWVRPSDGRTGLATASLVAALEARQVPVRVIQHPGNPDLRREDVLFDEVAQALSDAGPYALLAIPAYVWTEDLLHRICRRFPDAMTVLGGPQITYAAPGSLERSYPHADAFVRGYGELALTALAHDEPAEGLHLAGDPDLGIPASPALDSLPSPYLTGALPLAPMVRWETQRGCVYRCNFCQHRDPGGRPARGRLPLDRVRREIELFRDAGVKRINVLDPTFHQYKEHALAVLELMRQADLTAQITLQCRFERVTPAFLDALHGLDVELEFGLQTIIREEFLAVGRPNKLDKVEQAIHRLHREGVPFQVSLIYGLPGQTLASFRRSVQWCLDRGVPHIEAWPLMLLRGTELHARREQWGFEEELVDGIPIVVASQSFTRSDHEEMARIAKALRRRPPTRHARVGGAS